MTTRPAANLVPELGRTRQLEMYRRALKSMPGGTDSNFRAWGEDTIYVDRGKGGMVWDIDGNEYIDLLNGFGPILFGHRPDFLQEAIRRQLDQGFEIGPQTPLAGEIAELFCKMTGNDRMTFCNTGSEAVMAALRFLTSSSGGRRCST
jgi:glutamate-1-semialdehyde aminotransferase